MMKFPEHNPQPHFSDTAVILLHESNSDIQAKRRASVVANNYLGEKAIGRERAFILAADSMAFKNLGKRATWRGFRCNYSEMLVFYHVVSWSISAEFDIGNWP